MKALYCELYQEGNLTDVKKVVDRVNAHLGVSYRTFRNYIRTIKNGVKYKFNFNENQDERLYEVTKFVNHGEKTKGFDKQLSYCHNEGELTLERFFSSDGNMIGKMMKKLKVDDQPDNIYDYIDMDQMLSYTKACDHYNCCDLDPNMKE